MGKLVESHLILTDIVVLRHTSPHFSFRSLLTDFVFLGAECCSQCVLVHPHPERLRVENGGLEEHIFLGKNNAPFIKPSIVWLEVQLDVATRKSPDEGHHLTLSLQISLSLLVPCLNGRHRIAQEFQSKRLALAHFLLDFVSINLVRLIIYLAFKLLNPCFEILFAVFVDL